MYVMDGNVEAQRGSVTLSKSPRELMVKLGPETKSALHLDFLWMGIEAFSLQQHPKSERLTPTIQSHPVL